MRKEKIEVYAVIRVDEYLSGDASITVKEIVPKLDLAIVEVERLNNLNGDKDCHYFWQTTRYFPTME